MKTTIGIPIIISHTIKIQHFKLSPWVVNSNLQTSTWLNLSKIKPSDLHLRLLKLRPHSLGRFDKNWAWEASGLIKNVTRGRLSTPKLAFGWQNLRHDIDRGLSELPSVVLIKEVQLDKSKELATCVSFVSSARKWHPKAAKRIHHHFHHYKWGSKNCHMWFVNWWFRRK